MAQLHECELDEQARIAALLVGGFTAGSNSKGFEEESGGTFLRNILITLRYGRSQLQECACCIVLADEQVAEMGAQAADETLRVETFRENLVEGQHGVCVVACQEIISQPEVVFVIEDVQVLDDLLVGHFFPAEGDGLVEQCQGVAHGAVGFLGDDVHGVFAHRHTLFGCDALHVADHVFDTDAVEVVGLAAGKDGGQDLVLLSGGQDENRMGRRLFERLEEGVESLLRQHVHLVDDIHAVAADLRGDPYLVGQGADVVHGVIGRGVEFVDAVGASLREGAARLAFAARLEVRAGVAAVDGLGEDAGGAGLAYAARAAEEIGMRQLSPLD